MAKKKNKTLAALREIIEQHEIRFDREDGAELPNWASDMIREEVERLEMEGENE